MKKITEDTMVVYQGGMDKEDRVIHGCGMYGAAAMWASSPLGLGALGIGLLTYGGCLLVNWP